MSQNEDELKELQERVTALEIELVLLKSMLNAGPRSLTGKSISLTKV